MIVFFCYLGQSEKLKNSLEKKYIPNMSKSKILIADNDEMLLSMLKFRLEECDFEVISCNDGMIARNKVKEENPDLVVCEIMLPSVTGSELITYIKTEIEKSIPVIVLTSAGVERSALNAFKLGAEDFVSKPFSPNELILRISKALKHNIEEHF